MIAFIIYSKEDLFHNAVDLIEKWEIKLKIDIYKEFKCLLSRKKVSFYEIRCECFWNNGKIFRLKKSMSKAFQMNCSLFSAEHFCKYFYKLFWFVFYKMIFKKFQHKEIRSYKLFLFH